MPTNMTFAVGITFWLLETSMLFHCILKFWKKLFLKIGSCSVWHGQPCEISGQSSLVVIANRDCASACQKKDVALSSLWQLHTRMSRWYYEEDRENGGLTTSFIKQRVFNKPQFYVRGLLLLCEEVRSWYLFNTMKESLSYSWQQYI